MKIKKIAAICKPWKQVNLITIKSDVRQIAAQYIKAGAAIYPVRGLPAMNPEQLLTLFDIPEDKRKDWKAEECEPDPDRYCLLDNRAEDQPVDMIPISLEWGDQKLQPVKTSRGVKLIPVELFGPLELGTGMFELFERENSFGNLYLIAKVGMILQGIIFPEINLSETRMETFRELYRGMEESYIGSMEQEEVRLEQTRRNLGISENEEN
ncbi:MAG: hypothetical protein ACOX6P_11400 [Candidatus Merdivicinus sp.]